MIILTIKFAMRYKITIPKIIIPNNQNNNLGQNIFFSNKNDDFLNNQISISQ